MGKTIVITAGPTNEPIDAVMQITNMSTGKLGKSIAETLLARHGDEIDEIYYLSNKMAAKPYPTPKIKFIAIRDTDHLLKTLTAVLTDPSIHVDAVIHSAAVGDYKGRWAARAEDVAREIADRNERDGTLNYDEVLSILTSPSCLQDNGTKISSYEPNLMVMLDLTTKVIGHIKELAPDALLIGFKLLENVPHEELIRVAARLREKNHADYVVANDLSLIGGGKHPAWIVGKDGQVETKCETKEDIARVLSDLATGGRA